MCSSFCFDIPAVAQGWFLWSCVEDHRVSSSCRTCGGRRPCYALVAGSTGAHGPASAVFCRGSAVGACLGFLGRVHRYTARVPSEEVILEMDRLANEDHTHIATEEEIDVYRGNWWIRSNFVGSDTMPVRHRPDFKKALSTLHRLKKAEDKAYYQNWSQSSSSTWWQWQTSWWHPSFETSPRRWT